MANYSTGIRYETDTRCANSDSSAQIYTKVCTKDIHTSKSIMYALDKYFFHKIIVSNILSDAICYSVNNVTRGIIDKSHSISSETHLSTLAIVIDKYASCKMLFDLRFYYKSLFVQFYWISLFCLSVTVTSGPQRCTFPNRFYARSWTYTLSGDVKCFVYLCCGPPWQVSDILYYLIHSF